MNTEDILEEFLLLCERLVTENRTQKAITKAEIRRLCVELESPNRSKPFVDAGKGKHGRWLEHLYRIVSFSKGQRELSDVREAIRQLEP